MPDFAPFKIEWHDSGREPQVAPNPAYPNGIDLDLSPEGAHACTATLPYPAPRCGIYAIECRFCGIRVALTTAGRPDDPRSVRIPCKPIRGAGHA